MTVVTTGISNYVLSQTSPSPPGFLLLDSSLNPLGLNPEVVRVLSYSGEWGSGIDQFLEHVRARIFSGGGNGYPLARFQSGKRAYVCRAFPLKDGGGGEGTSIILLLERDSSHRRVLCRACKRFNFTERESMAVGHLLDGLTNKEIAAHMHISANTVKTFLRLIMIKMGVTTRSGIVGKLMTSPPD